MFKKIDMAFVFKAFLTLVIVLVLLSVLASLNGASDVLQGTDFKILAIAAVFFIISIILWLFSWTYLLKKELKISSFKIILTGFSSVFGSLTPVQLGADAMRSFLLKDLFKVPFTKSLSASMAVKGVKFSILALTSSAILAYFIFIGKLSHFMFFSLISGFVVVIAATLLFLLPLNKKAGKKIVNFFKTLSKRFSRLSRVDNYFTNYSSYLQALPLKTFSVVFLFSFLSWVFEFFALFFVFESLSISIPIMPLLTLFILLAVLERTPFTPKGLGLVEVGGFLFLSFPIIGQFSLSLGETASIMIVFNIVRIIVPVLMSILVFLLFVPRKLYQAKKS